jgi:hypothetical protein
MHTSFNLQGETTPTQKSFVRSDPLKFRPMKNRPTDPFKIQRPLRHSSGFQKIIRSFLYAVAEGF